MLLMPSTAVVNQFRKKPVTIHAVQVTDSESMDVIAIWSGAQIDYTIVEGESVPQALVVATLEGPMRATSGWWIIKGVEGEFYPCKDSVFRASYEPVAGEWPVGPGIVAVGQYPMPRVFSTSAHGRRQCGHRDRPEAG